MKYKNHPAYSDEQWRRLKEMENDKGLDPKKWDSKKLNDGLPYADYLLLRYIRTYCETVSTFTHLEAYSPSLQ